MSEIKYRHVFFLGIGGIGMSALARWLAQDGVQVSGYDRVETPLTQSLTTEGIQVYHTENSECLAGVDLIVYTPAVPSSHLVFELAERLGIPLVKRSGLLGKIAAGKSCIAVAGTHGKTSVTALLAHILKATGLDPLAFIGGVLRNYESNLLNGKGKYLVAEADEFDRSFLALHPQLAVITAIDPDHLDIYGDKNSFEEAFLQFANQVQAEILIPESLGYFANSLPDKRWITYGIDAGEAQATHLVHDEGYNNFDYKFGDYYLSDLQLQIPGRHNVLNAVAAITLSILAGAPMDKIPAALHSYRGVHRRMEVRVQQPGLVYIDDYAHHPREIQTVLSSVKEWYPEAFIRVAFQPHLFTRTRDFAQGFSQSLELADEVFLLDIYPARELPIPGVDAKLIGESIANTQVHYSTLKTLPIEFTQNLTSPSILLTLGAGDIDTTVSHIQHQLEERR